MHDRFLIDNFEPIDLVNAIMPQTEINIKYKYFISGGNKFFYSSEKIGNKYISGIIKKSGKVFGIKKHRKKKEAIDRAKNLSENFQLNVTRRDKKDGETEFKKDMGSLLSWRV